MLFTSFAKKKIKSHNKNTLRDCNKEIKYIKNNKDGLKKRKERLLLPGNWFQGSIHFFGQVEVDFGWTLCQENYSEMICIGGGRK